MPELIAVIDDEPDIRELIKLHLTNAGFSVKAFSDVAEFYRFLDKSRPDAIILDLMLPDADGLEVCKYLKQKEEYASIPILMLTARSEETDRVLGLELGADDYVTKPFSPRELAARVKAVLRRRTPEAIVLRIPGPQGLVIDMDKHEVTLKGRKINLTLAEFKILSLLASKRGRAFSRDQMLDHLWGREKAVVDRTIDVHIRNLREKLGEAGSIIISIRGVGYKLKE